MRARNLDECRNVETERKRAVLVRDIRGVCLFSAIFEGAVCDSQLGGVCVRVCEHCQNRAWSLFCHYGWVLSVGLLYCLNY